MTHKEYRDLFAEKADTFDGRTSKEGDTRAARALHYALDIRKFEIELYWKRATYFWTFIAAAFAGYALTYKTATDHEPWLSLIFSGLGLVFSFAWYLVNRGSKFWQVNWERHVDLLEDITLGPLYKTLASDDEESNPITGPGRFSVSKINQILSLYVFVIWFCLFLKSLDLTWPVCFLDIFKVAVIVLTLLAIILLPTLGRFSDKETVVKLRTRQMKDESP